ncbi:Lysine-specific histone demethylase 1A like protein [Verticillium longisporum]|uniref:Lysine-specific histone demethylase 1A like protein n=1 Tax=Verticillium longisporum TaxID=100787 RepID=A0A8I3AT05_VERLO|nr:Lysine-specific histone demethylase 1A like protein [Verticillium longisporum]
MSEIASEIVVHGEDMDVDDSMNDTSMATSAAASPAEFSGNEDMAEPSPHRDILQTNRNSLESPMSHTSEQSELSSLLSSVSSKATTNSLESPMSHTSEQSELSSLLSSVSSKATTPVDLDAAREPALSSARYSQPRQVPRRTYDIEPKSSVPAGLDDITYAAECIRAVEASRLDPFSLHQGEYQLLRQHITHNQVTTYLNVRNGIVRLWYHNPRVPVTRTHNQVTTYLNVRNGIVRLWYHNPRVPVTREQAIGCASVRWFDVASVCYDWLVRNGFINFGCVEFPTVDEEKEEEPPTTKQKTIVVIGGGMSGLGCARQLENLAKQYKDQFRELGELPPKVVVLEGRTRVGGRVYSRAFTTKPTLSVPGFPGERYTAEMGGMIITGFERGNPINVLLRGQLGLHYRALRPETTIYDSNGRPVDPLRDDLVEKLYNDCLDRVSEYKHHNQPSKLIRGNHDYIEHGRDSGTDGSKTIAESEEAAAALPHAAPVSQQNVPERVNRVPVSADKLTGRIHTEPGTPAASKASEKAKEMGWTLKNNITPGANIHLDDAAARPDATLGSVLDEAIGQYRNLVDLTAQDHRLINWHVANLEYSNATSLHNLSLGNWDIDAGNEWEGKHTMVAGGYQTVPRGLALCPTPLDLKTNAPVHKIKYSSEGDLKRSLVECEDGTVVEADYVISTIPLGVLKQGSVEFDPPLPGWKTDVIERIGFGVLNKVILVYDKPFWDTERHIFGVLRDAPNRHSLAQSDYASQRGRFFQWFNVTQTTGLPCLVALMAGVAGFDTERESNEDLVKEATGILRGVFGRKVPFPVEAVITRWGSDKFSRGSYSSSGPGMHPHDYDVMAKPVGNLYFAGEHTIGTHPATVHGAYMSGLRAASEVFDAMLGPIDIPSPLVLSKNSAVLKRKSPVEVYDPERARRDAHEAAVWDYIISTIGERPIPPGKVAANAYVLYNKAFFDEARKRCEKERSGKKKVSPNDVRVMTSKMWRAASAEERKPFEEDAVKAKAAHALAVQEYNDGSVRWDEAAINLRAEYEEEHDLAGSATLTADGKHRRTSKPVDYAEDDESVSE